MYCCKWHYISDIFTHMIGRSIYVFLQLTLYKWHIYIIGRSIYVLLQMTLYKWHIYTWLVGQYTYCCKWHYISHIYNYIYMIGRSISNFPLCISPRYDCHTHSVKLKEPNEELSTQNRQCRCTSNLALCLKGCKQGLAFKGFKTVLKGFKLNKGSSCNF